VDRVWKKNQAFGGQRRGRQQRQPKQAPNNGDVGPHPDLGFSQGSVLQLYRFAAVQTGPHPAVRSARFRVSTAPRLAIP
jgi:hypothetical protein